MDLNSTFLWRIKSRKEVVCNVQGTGSSRMKCGEKDFSKILEVFSDWVDPFETYDDLASLSSGNVASENTKQDLLNAKEKGTEDLWTFVKERLLSISKGFYETLPKLKLETFNDIQKSLQVKEEKPAVLRAGRNLFERMPVTG